MVNKYLKVNQWFLKLIWVIVILGLLSTLPIIYNRHQVEHSANQVEISFDYSDIVDLANYESNPKQFIYEQLKLMKESGINSMTVYESSLEELRENQYIKVLTSDDLYKNSKSTPIFNENYTYIYFENKEVQSQIEPLIIQGFAKEGIITRQWTFNDQIGLQIQLPKEKAEYIPLEPNPIVMNELKENGFQLIIRLSNRGKFNDVEMENWLSKFHQLGVTRMIIDGDEAPGYSTGSEKRNLELMGNLLNKYEIGVSIIEMSKKEQKGLNDLAKKVNYNVVRLHSLTDTESTKIADQIINNQSNSMSQLLSDRFVLAVKDRNIRLILLNAKPVLLTDKKEVINPLPVIYKSLSGEQGAITRIEKLNYEIGTADSFNIGEKVQYRTLLNMFILLGSVAMIVMLLSYFIRELSLILFITGTALLLGVQWYSDQYFTIMLSLALAISVPSLAVIRTIKKCYVNDSEKNNFRIGKSITHILITSSVSIMGVAFIVSLLDHISYLLVILQFRGVTLVHIIPILIVIFFVIYIRYYQNQSSPWSVFKNLMLTNINVITFVLIICAAIIGGYYLSRTGNNGQVLSIESTFRTFLENTLGIRPRTKEFLISHPLFIFAIYASFKYKNAIFLMILGIIGQISIVDTFLHIHTPLSISLIRISNGLWLGILLGVMLIVVWELFSRGWKLWLKK